MKKIDGKNQRILILGGGFGGIYAALRLEKALAGNKDIEITLINRDNYLLFTPMLPEVSSSSIEAKHIITPIRAFFKKVRFRDSEVESIDLHKREIRARHCPRCPGYTLGFDHLILALGSVTSFYRLPGIEDHALPLKSLPDAMALRNHVIDSLEHADMEPDPDMRRQLLTVVVAGAGLAGVEAAAELYDFLHRAKRFYPHIRSEEVRMVLVDTGKQILPGIPQKLAAYAHKLLAGRGIEVKLETAITSASAGDVELQDGNRISTRTLVWTAGVSSNPLLADLPCGKERGKIVVNDYLEVPEYPGVWAIGDCAHAIDPKTGRPYPAAAQHAVRQGKHAAENIIAALRGRTRKPFLFSSLGQLVPLGRRSAIAEIFGLKFRGFFAWWLWRTIYLGKLPGLERKTRVALDWTLELFFPKDIVLLKTMLKTNRERVKVQEDTEDKVNTGTLLGAGQNSSHTIRAAGADQSEMK